MTTKEILYQEIEDMTEEQKENTLRYASFIKKGVKIERFYIGKLFFYGKTTISFNMDRRF